MSGTLADLTPGEAFEGVLLLAGAQVLTTKTGKPYGALSLMDSGGSVDGRLWDRAEELLAGLAPGQPVRVSGRSESFNGRMQIIVGAIAPEPGADPSDFLPKSPVPHNKLLQRLTELTLAVKQRSLKRLLKAFFEDQEFLAAFGRAPAAKGAHHAYVHGLLEHTVCVGELARDLSARYRELDRDLLLTGALLHDVGKVREFSLGPPIEYTDEGRLVGHLVIGVAELDARLARLRSFPAHLADQLRHLILSHHGLYEFGSPRRPKTPEAFALHFCDDLDAKLAIFRRAMAEGAGGDSHWSGYNRLLERFLYLGPRVGGAGPAPAQEEDPEPGSAQPETPGLFGD